MSLSTLKERFLGTAKAVEKAEVSSLGAQRRAAMTAYIDTGEIDNETIHHLWPGEAGRQRICLKCGEPLNKSLRHNLGSTTKILMCDNLHEEKHRGPLTADEASWQSFELDLQLFQRLQQELQSMRQQAVQTREFKPVLTEWNRLSDEMNAARMAYIEFTESDLGKQCELWGRGDSHVSGKHFFRQLDETGQRILNRLPHGRNTDFETLESVADEFASWLNGEFDEAMEGEAA